MLEKDLLFWVGSWTSVESFYLWEKKRVYYCKKIVVNNKMHSRSLVSKEKKYLPGICNNKKEMIEESSLHI